jgi:hypothetical protein
VGPRAPVSLGREGGQHAVAQLDLLVDRKGPVPEDALVKLAGPTDSAAPVSERKIVEDEQFAGTQAHLDPDDVGT